MSRSPVDDIFYRLDNSAVFMASIAGTDGPLVFRMGFVLDRHIDLSTLTDSVKALVPRFPWLFVTLGSGLFWHYLEPVAPGELIEAEGRWPCTAIPFRRKAGLVRILPWQTRVAVEFHHVVCDGTAALVFCKALLAEYLARSGCIERDPEALAAAGIPSPGEEIDSEEGEDAYARYFSRTAPAPRNQYRAFLVRGRRRNEAFRETLLVLPLAPVLAYARSHRVSLTELLCAVHLSTLQEIWLETPAKERGSDLISVQVPINLRPIYPSKTLRNFFLFSAPSIDMRLGHWDFNEILVHVHHQMRLGGEKKELLRHLKRNVGGERNLLSRPVFLPMKVLVLRLINRFIGVTAYSGSLSNMGKVDIPPGFAPFVRNFTFTGVRSRAVGMNITVLSYNETLYLTLASTLESRKPERLFTRTLTALGFDVSLDSSEVFYSYQD